MAVTATEAGPDTWNVSTTPRTQSVTVTAGDYVVVYGVTADQTATVNTPTGGSLTYTLIGSVNVGSACYVAAWWALSSSSRTLLVRHGGRWWQVGHRPVQVASKTWSSVRIL